MARRNLNEDTYELSRFYGHRQAAGLLNWHSSTKQLEVRRWPSLASVDLQPAQRSIDSAHALNDKGWY